MEIKIETRNEYELLIRQQLSKKKLPVKTKELIQSTLMAVFDDGVLFAQGRLNVAEPKL